MKGILIILLHLLPLMSYAAPKAKQQPVVIVSSYNPDVKRVNENIEMFSSEYAAKGGRSVLRVENMNCRNLSESYEWRDRLWSLLSKYYKNGKRPAAVVLFGIEASTTYFSIDRPELKETPVVIGTRSNNIVPLPADRSTNLRRWAPESKLLSKDFSDYNIIGGDVYDYDVDKNLDILHKLYPQCDSLVFLSDNTLGGVTIRSFFVKEMKRHPKFSISFIDGRVMSFPQVNKVISDLQGNKAVIVGTWRIDSSETYALNNTTAALASSNKIIPAFSLSSAGLGLWALGGYVPDYQSQGAHLADYVLKYQQTGAPTKLNLIANHYEFDYTKVKELHIDKKLLPDGSKFINEPESFLREYKTPISVVLVVMIFLVIALCASLYYILLSKKLQKKLLQRSKDLEVARDKAEQANQMKSHFIANISHEIRTPLNAIVGFSQIITDPDMPLSDEERSEYGGYIKMNSDTLLNLVNDILDISKMDAKRMTFNLVETDLVSLCHTAAESAKGDLNANVSILTHLPANEVKVRTDMLRLQQVFNNLLSNAKKYTDSGSITIAIDNIDKKKKLVYVSVTDTGTGIPADKAEFIFERFKQIDNFKPGTGLGLSITRSIVENLGGRVWLDTSYTDGARFVFTHPIV